MFLVIHLLVIRTRGGFLGCSAFARHIVLGRGVEEGLGARARREVGVGTRIRTQNSAGRVPGNGVGAATVAS